MTWKNGREQPSDGSWTNMACIGRCSPRRHHYPTSVVEIIGLVKHIRSSGEHCRVAGAGKSPNTCAFTDGHLIHMDRLNRITSIDEQAMTITCEAGVLMHNVFDELSRHDLMLRCVPSYVETTVAGVIATATHSSGINSRSISDYVVKLQVVDGAGVLRTFDSSTPKELSLAACHLGVLGVVVSVTLQAERKSLWRLESRPIALSTLTQGDTLHRRINESEFYRFFWMPNTDCCYESIGTRIRDAETPTGNQGDSVMSATRKTDVSGSETGVEKGMGFGGMYKSWQKEQKSLRSRTCKVLKGNWLRHNVVEAALAASTFYPGIQPYINRAYRYIFYSTSDVQYGTSLECFSFDCLFKQWACEWAIDIDNALQAFHYLRDLIKSENLRVHFPVEFRFTGADSTALSPAHGRKTCWIGIVMYRPHMLHAPDTMRYYDAFSQAMTAIGGRPHWAKYYTWGPADVKAAYGRNWEDFLRLRTKMDPNDIFLNGWFNSLTGRSPVINSTISHL
uniref:Uncharacterized protein TCIL3000_5_2700 n=1 Tax=Trypanosoma congolense (strain IL3000) TaxID=1068625 RepID=G0UMZ9_TRYCI|nr:unnamed protein product [Trypanosoma congolense IL3000]